jgi:hypothetical protein
MKRLTLLFLISVACFAQATWQVCVSKTLDGKTAQTCQTISDDVLTAMTQAVQASQATPVPITGKANLIFLELQTFYQGLVEKYPSAAVKKLRDAAEIAASNAAKAAAAALPAVPSTEP